MRRILRDMLQTALLALFLFSGLQATVQNFRVEGSSMEPTLTEDQYLLVNKFLYYRIDGDRLSRFIPFLDIEPGEPSFLFHQPARGEIIVFHYPRDVTRDFVKRVIAVPGDTVEMRGGRVYVNGMLVEEPYLTAPYGRTDMAEQTIGADEYFVMGDNRRQSNDSRSWGTVPLSNVVGKAWFSYWPSSKADLF
jgi:signal peptidase I